MKARQIDVVLTIGLEKIGIVNMSEKKKKTLVIIK